MTVNLSGTDDDEDEDSPLDDLYDSLWE